MKRYRTGHIPDPAGHRRTPFAHLSHRLKAQTLPDSFSLLPFTPPIMDQGDTGSCTGHATGAAIFTALASAGDPLPWVPSPKDIYTLGRAIDRVDPIIALTDDGAEPNQVMRGITEYGVRAMTRLPDRLSDCELSTINDEPTLAELEADAQSLILGEYGIATTGKQREQDLMVALAVAKRPVTIAIAGGSDPFQEYSGGILEALNAPLDHYIYAFGYETLPTGELALVVGNSWAVGWGEVGRARLGELAIAELGDIIVFDVKKGAS